MPEESEEIFAEKKEMTKEKENLKGKVFKINMHEKYHIVKKTNEKLKYPILKKKQ